MMATTAKINVVQKRAHRLVAALQHLMFWVILVGAIAVSRTWLGGSFLVEAIAAFFAVTVLVRWITITHNIEVEMDLVELRIWLADGAPKDVGEWRAIRSLKMRTVSPMQDNG